MTDLFYIAVLALFAVKMEGAYRTCALFLIAGYVAGIALVSVGWFYHYAMGDIPIAVAIDTAIALLIVRNTGVLGILQALLLLCGILTNGLLLIELSTGTVLVHAYYEQIIMAINFIQLSLFLRGCRHVMHDRLHNYSGGNSNFLVSGSSRNKHVL